MALSQNWLVFGVVMRSRRILVTDSSKKIRRAGSRDGYPFFAGRYFPNWFNNPRNSLTNFLCSFVVSIGSRKVTNKWHFFRLSFG